MKNITLSAKDELIDRAREVARERNTTLNQMFRDWLETLDPGKLRVQEYNELMERLTKRVKPGKRKFTREEMNER